MKSILSLLLLCLCTSLARAQSQPLDSLKFPLDADTHRITYAEVVPAEGISQAELYARAKLWFASTFKSAKDVVQAEDKEAGVMQGKGWQDIYIKSMGIPSASKLWYTVKLAVKEGRYRYEITEFEIQSYPSKYQYNPSSSPAEGILLQEKVAGMFKGIIRQERQQVNGAAQTLASAIKTGMAKPAAGTSAGKSDW